MNNFLFWVCVSACLDLKVVLLIVNHFFVCSNVLFREFALISMWRVPAMPLGAHTLLRLLAEPLNQLTETPFLAEDYDVSENLKEFNDWVCF